MSEIKTQDELLREVTEEWVVKSTAMPSAFRKEEVYAKHLADHLRDSGVIVVQPTPKGTTPGQLLSDRSDIYWDGSSEEYKRNCEDRAANLLSAYAPKPGPAVPKHIKGATLGELLYVANGGHSSVYQSTPHDSPLRKDHEERGKQLYAAFALAPEIEPAADATPLGLEWMDHGRGATSKHIGKYSYGVIYTPGINDWVCEFLVGGDVEDTMVCESLADGKKMASHHWKGTLESLANGVNRSEPAVPLASAEQIVRDVLEKAEQDGLIEMVGDEDDDETADMQSFTAGDLCGPANVLVKHLKRIEQGAPDIADLLAKLPVPGEQYRHNGELYEVESIYYCDDMEEKAIRYHKVLDDDNWFIRPLRKWLEGDYQLVNGE